MGESKDSLNRRQLLKWIPAMSATMALSGCSRNDEPDGERVPTINLGYFSRGGVYDDVVPVVVKNLEEFGLDVDTNLGTVAEIVGSIISDSRTNNLWLHSFAPSPLSLDPDELLWRLAADNEFRENQMAFYHWLNCDATDAIKSQVTAPTREKREDFVFKAQELFADDWVLTPLFSAFYAGAVRSDLVTPENTEGMGISYYNPDFQVNSSPKGDLDSISIGTAPEFSQTLHPYRNPHAAVYTSNLTINSPLLYYDGDFNLVGVLAEEHTIEEDEDEWRVEVVLREGGTFHNGDPITAEDVKFTMEHIEDNVDAYPQAQPQGYSQIDAPNENTVVFRFDEPNLPFITQHLIRWGISPKDAWEEMGADENTDINMTPENFVGSGPFIPANLAEGQLLSMEPHDGHPFYSTANHQLEFKAYQGGGPLTNALIAGDIEVAWEMPYSALTRLENELSDDEIQTVIATSFTPTSLGNECHFGPTMFPEFRRATGMAIDRTEVAQVAFDGKVNEWLACTLFGETHPWRAPDDQLNFFTENPQGDMDRAIELLEENGWELNDGTWYYPPDADLTPQWPKGENPNPDDFPCIDEQGNYIE